MAPVFDQVPLIVYGFGATGRKVVDHLLGLGAPVVAIADAHKSGGSYRGLPICSLGDLQARSLSGTDCLVALHNHYVDLAEIDACLKPLGFRSVYGLSALARAPSMKDLPCGYWLEPLFSYSDHSAELDAFRSLLADEASRVLLDSIVRYRTSGVLSECPAPSLSDEYTPVDLPRFCEPMRLVDCGAYDGAAIRRFRSAGYKIDAILAFEPDAENFASLSQRWPDDAQGVLMPLPVWSANAHLHFAAQGSMSSGVSGEGGAIVQAVRLDDIAKGFAPTLVKMDVEGAELEALKGMENMLRAHRPDLCLSLYHTPRHLYEIPLFVDSLGLGYRFHLRVHEHNTFGVVLYAIQARA
jgi:FkbM family methyltransferase